MQFLEMVAQRIARRDAGNLAAPADPVPWALDDKYAAYDFMRQLGWRVPAHVRTASLADAIEAGRRMGARFVVKQPGLHSSVGIWVLEALADGRYLDMLQSRVLRGDEIKAVGAVPPYWMVEAYVEPAFAWQRIPLDYKIYAFNGQISHVIQIDRSVRPFRVALFDQAFLPLQTGQLMQLNRNVYRVQGHVIPQYAGQMLAMAAQASAKLGTRFVRVDCFDGAEGAVFGEFTFTPGAENARTFQYVPSVLAALDALTRGERLLQPFSGIGLDSAEMMADMAAQKAGLFEGEASLLSLISAGARERDLRYGAGMARLAGAGRLGEHAALAVRLAGFFNGDQGQAFPLQETVRQGRGYCTGAWPALAQVTEVALRHHRALAHLDAGHAARAEALARLSASSDREKSQSTNTH